jgi:excisionase family DNA binding protein
MLNHYPDVLSVKEVSEILRIGKNSTYALLSNKDIASRRIGKRFLIPKKCLIDFLNETRHSNDRQSANKE